MDSVAATKSRSTTGCAAPRATRATRGAVVSAIATMISQLLAPSRLTATRASMICGKAMMTSIARISTSSRALRAYAATRPIAHADDQTDRGGDDRHDEDAPAAVQEPAEHVLAEVVGAEEPGALAAGGELRDRR